MIFPVLRLIYRHLTDGPLLPVPEFGAERAILDAPLRRARRDVGRGDWTAAGAVIQEAGDDWELRDMRIGGYDGCIWPHQDGLAWLHPRGTFPHG
jgi:hypothetical protein